ncbi:MFS general substrate transporter [Dacryopinax primogenitus]|uniref:MFS general substrate transporter n=1 Tax=Dacryopinax primogenitus (strain DJM 731) TaxID=1858805 RepID=M5G5Y6_DACPD|nr:MFS general substrate transporter [Dacryopinax primogenitus]EJU01202.1 MFS general substrate transporter [Dacryopinax primogenitus]
MIPLLMCMYVCGYLDRTNLGNARLQGLPQDVLGGDPTGQLFAWINSGFYFAYVFGQFPGVLGAKKAPLHLWLGGAAFGWGFVCAMQALAFNFASLFMCRIFIGIFEAMFSPNMCIYWTYFYTREEIGKRLGIWFSCANVAGAFGGLIAFGVQNIHGSIHNWRLLFIIEGIPAAFFGLVAMKVLPNRPEKTKYLNDDERKLAILRMSRGALKEEAGSLNWKHVRMAALDWKTYVAGTIYFGANCAAAALGAFLPTIIASMGYSAAQAQLLTVPPYTVGAVVLILTTFGSDHYQSRGIPMIFSTFIGGTGYLIMLCVESNIHVRYFATFLICISTYTTIGLCIAWFPYNMGSESKRAMGNAMYQAIGQCGSILGSNIYPLTQGPRYLTGFGVTCGFAYLSTILALILTVYCRMENKRRDKKYGYADRHAAVDVSELADHAPMFRYTP